MQQAFLHYSETANYPQLSTRTTGYSKHLAKAHGLRLQRGWMADVLENYSCEKAPDSSRVVVLQNKSIHAAEQSQCQEPLQFRKLAFTESYSGLGRKGP